MTSPFLEALASARVAENALAFALEDRFPVSPGHTLVIPRRLIATWFEATPEERTALFELVDEVKRALDERFHPEEIDSQLEKARELRAALLGAVRGLLPAERDG